MMLKKLDLEVILEKNPHIHIEDFDEYKTLTEELRKMGIHSRGYQLASPFARKHVGVCSEDEVDHRTINLTGV